MIAMLMIICLFVMCCVLLFFVWTRIALWQSDDVEPPMFSGALPIIGHSHQAYGDTTHFMDFFKRLSMECNDKGGVMKFTFGPIHLYVVTDPVDCLTAMNKCTEKSEHYNFAKRLVGDGLITANDKTWQVHRKLLNPMFTRRVLNSSVNLFNARARHLVDKFQDKLGNKPFEYEHYLLVWNMESACKTIIGVDVDDGEKENNDYVNAINAIAKIFTQRVTNVWYHNEFLYSLSTLKRKEERLVRIIRNRSCEVLLKRKQIINDLNKQAKDMQDDSRPFIDHILMLSNEHEVLTDREVLDEVNTLMAAGYDTTGHALAFIFMMLGAHKEVQDLVYKELESLSLNCHRNVDKYDLQKLVYTEAVIKETLRLYPILPAYARRINTNIKLTKYTLRAGCHLIVSALGMCRSPAWGADADKFRPERWLDPKSLPENSHTFSVFGMGKRSCIGRTYSMMFMKTTLVHILRNYKITSHSYNPSLKIEVVLTAAVPMYINLESRH